MRSSVGSMFAGIGGFDLGFERAGFTLAWCIEKDVHAQKVLSKRFPRAKIYGDITQVDASTLERVDVICGGFPCQDVSVAGKRAGLAGGRTGLFYDAIRIVRQLQPRLLVLENVAGLLSSNNGLDFAAVIREVGEGWDCAEVAWRILDSQFFGVSQRRRRVFVVASAAIGHAEQILALNESVCGDPPTRRETGQDAASDSDGSVDPYVARRRAHGQAVAHAFYSTGGSHGLDSHPELSPPPKVGSTLDIPSPVAVAYRKSRRAQSSTDYETWVDDGLANTLNGFDTGDTRTTHAVAVFPIDLRNATRDAEKLDSQNRQGCGIGSEGDPSSTLLRHHTPAVALPASMVVRRLTPVECERLQGFPDGWTDIGTTDKPTSDTHRYKQCGNAVTVNVAEWIARRAMECLQ